MPNATLWRALLGVENTVVELVEYDPDEQVVIAQVTADAPGRWLLRPVR